MKTQTLDQYIDKILNTLHIDVDLHNSLHNHILNKPELLKIYIEKYQNFNKRDL